MEVLNVLGLILGIVSSAISIYVFFIERPRRRAQPAEETVHVPPQPARRQQTASSPPPPPPAPETQQAAPAAGGFSLGKAGAMIWGLLGFGCLSEGMTFGEPFLMVLGGGFLWLAYKMWKK